MFATVAREVLTEMRLKIIIKRVEALRVEVARVMLEEGSHSVGEVADETGFGERERMRRSFIRAFGRPPQAVRRDLREVRR